MLKIMRLLTKALLRKIVLPPVPMGLDVLVVSPGGVATTMVMEQIEYFKRVNDVHDGDGLKHLPRPPRVVGREKFTKVLFVYGDVYKVSQSIQRREWLRIQAAKLACPSAVILPNRLAALAFEHCVAKQHLAWSMIDPCRVLFVAFDDIWDRLPEIAQFLEIADERFVTAFPPRRHRHTDGQKQSLEE